MQMISWGQLISMIVLGAVAWYGYVLLRYYRHRLFKVARAEVRPVKWTREPAHGDDTTPHSDVHAQVHELMQESKEIFAAAEREQLTKAQVFEALAHRLSKYTHLPANIKVSVTQHIVNEFSLQLKLSISEHEINALW